MNRGNMLTEKLLGVPLGVLFGLKYSGISAYTVS